MPDIPEPDQGAVGFPDDHVVEFFRSGEPSLRADGQLGAVTFDPSGREFDILTVQRIPDITGVSW